MIKWLILVGLAATTSLDNLGMGICYGIRNMYIDLKSNMVISGICFIFSMVGLMFGKWIVHVCPGILPSLLATCILFVVGLRIVLLAAKQPQTIKHEKKITTGPSFEQITVISLAEASVLGIALSTNALTNGLNAGLFDFPSFSISFIAAMSSFASIWLGMILGNKMMNIRIGRYTIGQFSTVCSGVIMIIIAIHAMMLSSW